jgi:hypothetical protein
MIVSLLYKLILEAKCDLGYLPPVLHVSVDNCWRENKARAQLLDIIYISSTLNCKCILLLINQFFQISEPLS